MIKIVDNFIPLKKQEEYKHQLLVDNFPWFYTADVTNLNNVQKRPSLSHLLYCNNTLSSNYIDVDVLGKLGAMAAGTKFNSILNAKTILQLPLNENFLGKEKDALHVDTFDPYIDHLVVLYYVIDADGDTVIYDKKIEDEYMPALNADYYTILKKVTPKQGRAVIFDGRYYHTAEQPKKDIRCVINLNVI